MEDHALETGLHTQTGGRLLAARDYLGEQDFMLTYGDGVADVDIGTGVVYEVLEGVLY